MQEDVRNSKRIAKNTAYLYFRMLIMVLVNLYTSRVILEALGVDDFALYNVVGGLVALFSVISGTLSAAISRFIVYELGRGDEERLQLVFSTSVLIQLMLVGIVVLVAETLGVVYVNHYLSCPPERLTAVFWCFQLSLVAFCINLMSVPYNAEIIAHEQMNVFAYFSIFEAFATLGISFAVAWSSTDRLILYSLCMCALAVIMRACYAIYCKRRYKECVVSLHVDKPLLKQMLSFAGWNTIGAAAGVIRDQGGIMLVNLFFPLSVNGAMALATKVNSQLQRFAQNFMTALNPQITKSYARNDMTYMYDIVFVGSRFSYYLLLLLSLPIMLNIGTLLDLWLVDVPPLTEHFVTLMLVLTLSESLSYPLITAMLATGRIRNYQIVVGGLQLLNIPVSYVLFKLHFPSESIVCVAIVLSQVCLCARLLMLRGMIGLNVRRFMLDVYANVATVTIVAAGLSYALNHCMEPGTARLLLMSPLIVVLVAATEFIVGCKRKERAFLLQKLQQFTHKRARQ